MNKDVVKLLLNLSDRIELNARDNSGRIAFIWAYQMGHKDVFKLLFQNSNDLDNNIPENMYLSIKVNQINKKKTRLKFSIYERGCIRINAKKRTK